MIIIPNKTPDGREVKTVGIWMSGGADSTILTYLLAKNAKMSNKQLKVMTTRRPRPTNPMYAVPVIEKIQELLDFDFEHVIYYPKVSDNWQGKTEDDNYANGHFFEDMNAINFSKDNFQVLYSGVTKNPPQSVQITFHDGISKEEPIRGVNQNRPLEFYGDGKDYTTYRVNVKKDWKFWQLCPFFDMDKKGIAELYQQENVLEELFPLTRSCESTEIWTEHCGKCWWCEERQWAFGRLV